MWVLRPMSDLDRAFYTIVPSSSYEANVTKRATVRSTPSRDEHHRVVEGKQSAIETESCARASPTYPAQLVASSVSATSCALKVTAAGTQEYIH